LLAEQLGAVVPLQQRCGKNMAFHIELLVLQGELSFIGTRLSSLLDPYYQRNPEGVIL
jgi:hypothetical protein